MKGKSPRIVQYRSEAGFFIAGRPRSAALRFALVLVARVPAYGFTAT
jgi:hypothetical protein